MGQLLIPEKLALGDDWQWVVCSLASAYPASLYTLKFFFRSAGAKGIDITATADGDNFSIDVPKADQVTATLVAGTYSWSACVFSIADSSRTEIQRGTIEILADIAAVTATTAYDGRTHNRIMLDAIRAVLEGRASRVEEEYSIGGRMLRLLKPAELEQWAGRYAWRVRNEEIRDGQVGSNAGQIRAGFGPPVNKVPSDGGTIL